uniref:WDR90 4th beta-propeller domain-containing protein n=1 Tax=Canis lupus dingo TaxID=286419 RepID=A0A8C0K9L5_CANLU
ACVFGCAGSPLCLRAAWPRGAGSLQVNEVVFSPSASHWATCSDDGSVRVWSLASMELLIQFQVLNQSCLCLAWSPASCARPEQQQVAAGYSDGTLRVFSISRIAMELKMHPHRAALTAIAYSADGQTILSGDKDGLVAVSRPRTGMTFRVLSDHRGALISTVQSRSKEHGDFGAQWGDLWLAASSDQRISVWAANWPQGHCELVDWLSSPSPTLMEVGSGGSRGGGSACPPDHSVLRPFTGSQPTTVISCCLLPLGRVPAGVCGPRRASRGGLL